MNDLHMNRANKLMNLNGNYAALVSSDNNSEVPFGGNNIHRKVSFSKQGDDMEPTVDKVSENSSECNPSVVTSKASTLQHIDGHHRIRKLLASRSRKVAPMILQDGKKANYGTLVLFLFYTMIVSH